MIQTKKKKKTYMNDITNIIIYSKFIYLKKNSCYEELYDIEKNK